MILITGGAGFIGSRLALHLIRAGEPFVILDNYDPFYDPARKRANVASVLAGDPGTLVIDGDIRDRALIDSLFERYRFRAVAHLAAMANVRSSVERGPLYADVNTSASVALMDAARRYGVELFILGSTSSVYGNTDRVPFVEEDAAMFPLAPYPASKRAAELFGHSYHNMFGLNVTCLRFFNVYGPHGRPDMMPYKAIESILKGVEIPMFDNGALQRDWTYIDDIVAGIYAALHKPLGYAIVNLGCGSPIRFSTFVDIYEELIGKAAIRKDVPAPMSEPKITFCDNTRARTLLGFAPRTAVQDGLSRTWTWYRDEIAPNSST